MMTKRLVSLGTALLLTITMVACGGDDKDANDEDTDANVGGSAEVDLEAGLVGEFADECERLVPIFERVIGAIGLGMGGAGDTPQESAKFFEEISGTLPEEIRADFQIFAAAYSRWADAIADFDIDYTGGTMPDQSTMAEVERLGEAILTKVEVHLERVEAYMEGTCVDF